MQLRFGLAASVMSHFPQWFGIYRTDMERPVKIRLVASLHVSSSLKRKRTAAEAASCDG
jgi:hypothetical protein